MRNWVLLLFAIFIFPAWILGQVASQSDDDNIFYYETLHEAYEAAVSFNSSIETPVEITLLKDIVLDESLVVGSNVHIRFVTGDSPVIIQRGVNNLQYPLIWIRGENASITLGKPAMEQELFIDGGYLNEPPIFAQSSLIAAMGPNSKLIMYDKVTIQNNYNDGVPLVTSGYKHGSGIFISSADAGKPSEFIMKGGTIRGNTNNVNNTYASGGGVLIINYGIFSMEGGSVMNNTAQINGGGLCVIGGGTFIKTGGIIYGNNAPAGLRNIVLEGAGSPKTYGHSICVAVLFPVIFRYRNDTVKENDNLSYFGSLGENGIFGDGEKWNTPNKVFRRNIFIVIFSLLAFCTVVFFIILQLSLKKRKRQFEQQASSYTPYDVCTLPVIDFEGLNITVKEKEILDWLLTDLSIKQIAFNLKLTHSGVNFHIKKLYQKLNVHSRPELFAKFARNSEEK